MSSENERLQRELAYLSNLINHHKSSQQGVGTGRAPARDHHVPQRTVQRTAEDSGQHHGLRKDSQKPYFGNKKLDLRSSKTLNYQSTNKLSVRSVCAPQSKPVVVKDKAVPTSKVVNVLPNVAPVDTLLSKQVNVTVPKSSSKISVKGNVTGNITSKQNPGLPPQTKGMSKGLPVSKPNSKRVVLKPGSKIASSVHKTDVIPVTSISQESIEAALSKPSQQAPGLTRADLLRTSIGKSASIPSANHRRVLLPKDKIDAQALISPLTSSQGRVRYSSSVPSTVINTAKCNKETSSLPDDKKAQVFSGKPSAKSKHYFTDGFGPRKPASSAVKTTEKIEAAQELLNQLKAMKTQNPEGLRPQRHFSAPQLNHVTSQQKHQPYTTPGVMTAGASSQHQTQNRYRKVYSSRVVSPLKLSLDRNLFDDSGVPSPIVNLSTSWSGDALPPMVSTPNWLCDRIDGNVKNPNFSSSSPPKSVHNASVYSSPSKYSLVRNKMASDNTTSIVSSRKKSNSENLSSLSRSNLMVVKLRTKYKLVKKAIQTQQRSSYKLRSPQYTVSPRGQPGYRQLMVKNSFRKAGASKWTNTSRYLYNNNSRNLSGYVAHASMNRYALKSPYTPQLQRKSRFAKAKASNFSYSYSYSRKYVRAIPSRHRVDRRVNQTTARSYPTANKKFVMIGGALYQSSRQKLMKASKSAEGGRPYCKRPVNSSRLKTITVRGDDKFAVGRKGKSLRRLSRDKSTENATLVMSISRPPTSAQLVAGRALQRSIHTASMIRYKKSAKLKEKEYCKFYSRFGRCNRGEKCKFIHDSEKVAVCTRFLRGTCKVTDCPFSHKVAPEKMPVCSYFLKGICSRDNCPYAHVNVNRDAQICQDFVNGFCGLGSKCTKRHSLICREFASTGSCSKGCLCKLRHPLSRKRKRSRCAGSTEEPGLGQPLRKRKRDKSGKGEVKQADDINLPMSKRNLPSFIAIGGETDESTLVTSGSAVDNSLAVGNKQKKMMFIKPRLSFDPADNSLV